MDSKPAAERLDSGRRWVSISVAAELIGCHPQTAYFWASTGRIPVARIGRKLLVDRLRLKQDLERQAAGQGGKSGRL